MSLPPVIFITQPLAPSILAASNNGYEVNNVGNNEGNNAYVSNNLGNNLDNNAGNNLGNNAGNNAGNNEANILQIENGNTIGAFDPTEKNNNYSEL